MLTDNGLPCFGRWNFGLGPPGRAGFAHIGEARALVERRNRAAHRTHRPSVVALVAFALLLPACASDPPEPSTEMLAEPAAAREVAVATTVAFTEGPTVAEDGTVYFTDLGNNRIMRLSTDGQLSTYRQPSHRANGLIFDSEWRLLACESGDGDTILPRVTRTNMETGEIEVIADAFEGKQLHSPNDLSFDGQGRIYFTDRPGPNPRPEQTGVHGVYRIDPDGTVARILTEPEVMRPNGIVISPTTARCM